MRTELSQFLTLLFSGDGFPKRKQLSVSTSNLDSAAALAVRNEILRRLPLQNALRFKLDTTSIRYQLGVAHGWESVDKDLYCELFGCKIKELIVQQVPGLQVGPPPSRRFPWRNNHLTPPSHF